MMKRTEGFRPRFQISGTIAASLMAIEADRQIVARVPLSARVLDSLRRTARLLATHYSTQIEGNRLSPGQIERVVDGEGNFPSRERDELEVRNYFAALQHVESLAKKLGSLTERHVREIHGLVMTGKIKPTRYRDGQNAIRDSRGNRLVYLPPEAHDVGPLMRQFVAWINEALATRNLPIPVVAAIAHYQFATIHPYFDGNGRTARLLTTLILHASGYSLGGIYSLEEYYADHLDDYYSALAVGQSHNYYFGRIDADITTFVEYFCAGMADAFAKVRVKAERIGSALAPENSLLRTLSPRQRNALGLFRRSRVVTAMDVAKFFRMKPRNASLLCAKWAKEGFLSVVNPSTKGRSYRLADPFEELIES